MRVLSRIVIVVTLHRGKIQQNQCQPVGNQSMGFILNGEADDLQPHHDLFRFIIFIDDQVVLTGDRVESTMRTRTVVF